MVSQLEHLVSNTCVCDSLNLPQETKSAIQEKKVKIALQFAPLKMHYLNEKQPHVGQRKYPTQHHRQAWNAHL